MADIGVQKGPDSYQNHQERPAYIKTTESLGVSPKTGNAVIDTKRGVATILIAGETKKETSEINETFKKEFTQKLKKLPDYEGSKVQEAIEKGTIEIKKIPNRNGYAIYESKTGNLVYLTYLDGRGYTNIHKYRTKEMLSDIFEAGYLRQGYGKIELDNKTGLWRLYKKDGKEVLIFSDEYATATLNAINTMWDFVDYIEEVAEKRGLKKKD